MKIEVKYNPYDPVQRIAKERHDRQKYAKDLVQPSDSKFRKHYPEQYAEMEKAMEKQEIKEKQRKKSKDDFFDKHKNSLHSKEMRNILKLEEQLEHGKK